MSNIESEFRKEQEKWLSEISLKNTFKLNALRLVAGVDLAYWTEAGKEYGVCCIVVVDYQTKEIIEKVDYHGEIMVPYIPGFLAFRELPLVLKTVEKLQQSPDLYMFDGNGYLHSRHMGIATHASFYLNKPTIGVAKTYFKIEKAIVNMPKDEVGASESIQVGGEEYGLVLRTRKNVKPIYISCGNGIELETAKAITMHFVEKESRLPITTRYADLETHTKRKEYSSIKSL
ncbi:endonuclease V [Candidatus Enterococcus clewellii]|uniref:Endonuclease V n=1 Tax=Candidatus Enterococcus clewellii TaxID=1834193 RepID=A0A242KD73_9ENTE|nr:endonuclease V [Enterococcus sp. 9E7_DIV0242]OTP19019.1 hypothetical protein A5888_000833 [Enterococcus sp. 9E7_DIV0242]